MFAQDAFEVIYHLSHLRHAGSVDQSDGAGESNAIAYGKGLDTHLRASFPLGMLIKVRSSVLTLVERRPIVSTVPTKSSMRTKSPSRKGLVRTDGEGTEEILDGFLRRQRNRQAANAQAATKLVTGYPSSESNATTPKNEDQDFSDAGSKWKQ